MLLKRTQWRNLSLQSVSSGQLGFESWIDARNISGSAAAPPAVLLMNYSCQRGASHIIQAICHFVHTAGEGLKLHVSAFFREITYPFEFPCRITVVKLDFSLDIFIYSKTQTTIKVPSVLQFHNKIVNQDENLLVVFLAVQCR